MNGLPYYRAYPRDFLDGTVGMALELKGAYRLVLDLIYMQGGGLPDDARYISGHLGCSLRKWASLRSELIAKGKLQVISGLLTNYRADKELETLGKFQDKQRENATKVREINKVLKAVAKPKASHTDTDTYTEIEVGSISVTARKRAKPKTRIPFDALISPEMRAAAEQRGLSDAEAEAQFVKFRDWALAKGQAYADWNAAWRNWLTSDFYKPITGNVHHLRGPNGPTLDDYLDHLKAGFAVERID